MNLNWDFKKVLAVLVAVFFCLVFPAETLEMRVFQTGQANAIGLKIGDSALFVDIGGTDGEVINNMRDFINETNHNVVLVTHQHVDHFDKIVDVFARKELDKLYSRWAAS
jgi:metal-dependent hydrolase (beta-lactamase superfamily II)